MARGGRNRGPGGAALTVAVIIVLAFITHGITRGDPLSLVFAALFSVVTIWIISKIIQQRRRGDPRR